ncbi:acyl carrier protein [Amycolatopsis sp. PS_44_ISF1]|uniref:acyl carrier protein n=1 Tax=Amycolatopsis sp. PS_44_ISF1 TaxID=2974917 RepID=UPI0028DF8DBE|nr:acyl carrier protein [Amycolatopsis sp. PS_44_ISF1]MDT8910107.1 acyl carrier protein [Amycolatopsis sp. PS_44_ISF1]
MLTLEDLKQVLRTCGTDESVDLDGDILDVEMAELGYDSLAVLEISARLQQRSGREIPEDVTAESLTLRQLLGYINNPVGIA